MVNIFIEMRKKQLLYSVKLSHKYYMKCMTYFAYVDWSRQTDEWCFLFLRATIELSALIKNSNPEKSKNKFLESFRPLITVLPALERLTCKSYNNAQPYDHLKDTPHSGVPTLTLQ